MSFDLHPQLATDTFAVGELPLCRVLMMNDAQYPWCILVPRRGGVREIYELDDADQQQLLKESTQLSRALMAEFRGDKLNVAALGNMVPHLHWHVIARFGWDSHFPASVWSAPQRLVDEAQAAAVASQCLDINRRIAEIMAL